MEQIGGEMEKVTVWEMRAYPEGAFMDSEPYDPKEHNPDWLREGEYPEYYVSLKDYMELREKLDKLLEDR